MSKKELKQQIEKAEKELEELKKITEIGNTEAFDFIIKKIKENMTENINEEDWKSFKQNKAKIEKMRGFTEFVEKQTQLIEEKEDELEELNYELNHYQLGLFDEDEPEETEIDYCGQELLTGDVFGINGAEESYLLVAKSQEKEGNFALISNKLFDDERLLQYPANVALLDSATYIGNLLKEPEKQEFKAITNAFYKD
jgi:hypothetical protein